VTAVQRQLQALGHLRRAHVGPDFRLSLVWRLEYAHLTSYTSDATAQGLRDSS
jgi:hypothetical protein